MAESGQKKRSPFKGLIAKIRDFGLRRQRVFYAPKQLPYADASAEFDGAEVGYIINFTNNVIKLTLSGREYYFKEARERCGLKRYVEESVRLFFSEVSPDPRLEAEILESLRRKSNFKKLVNMGNKDMPDSPLNAYLISGDGRCLGLPSIPQEKKAVERKLIFYLYGEINNYHFNCGVKRGDRQTFLATRAVAVKRLADMLSVGRLIPETRYVRLTINGRGRYGALEACAEGVDLSPVPPSERKKHITPVLLRELTTLNVLDALCCDNDHRVNNYHTVTEGGDYIGVTSFDNDSPNVFLPTASINVKHSTGCSRLIDGRGLINRPHLDGALARSLLNTDKKSLDNLRDLLSFWQIAFLWKRIKKLQRAVKKTVKRNPDFLLDKDGWTEEHIGEELSGRYGKTYLVSFLSDCYYPDGLHPFDAC